MDLQLRKLNLIEWLTKVQDETTVFKIEDIQKKARIERYESSLKPMTKTDLIARAIKAEADIKAGRVFTSEEVEKEMENW